MTARSLARALLGLPVALALAGAVIFNVENRNNGSLVSQGENREYLIHVPRSYDPARPTPLVISMHGGALWPTVQREFSRWDEVADRHGFIVVYPSGTWLGRHKVWRAGTGAGHMKDVHFISDLIDTLGASYNIDPSMIYADGLSNGGGMAFKLSCELSDRIAAVGMVGAARFLPWSECRDSRPVPVIAFHGTDDRFARYTGGQSFVAPRHWFPNIPVWMKEWARKNRCGPEATESQVASDVTRAEYPDCADGASVVLYTVLGGGHTWPGGGPMPEYVGKTTHSVDASSLTWEFFRRHPRPAGVNK